MHRGRLSSWRHKGGSHVWVHLFASPSIHNPVLAPSTLSNIIWSIRPPLSIIWLTIILCFFSTLLLVLHYKPVLRSFGGRHNEECVLIPDPTFDHCPIASLLWSDLHISTAPMCLLLQHECRMAIWKYSVSQPPELIVVIVPVWQTKKWCPYISNPNFQNQRMFLHIVKKCDCF